MPELTCSTLDRRGFLRAGGTALLGVALSSDRAPALLRGRWRDAAAADVRIDVLPWETIGPVTPLHYGHFIEHLGGVIYDGVWVGERSSIPNVGGIRKALVDDLRGLTPGIVRWPGGCFADSYDWRDGIGPREERPRRASFWAGELPASVTGPSRYEPNHFGSPEFMRFCRLIGAEPYLAVNGRGLGGREFAHWVEYCNAPAGTTTFGDRRVRDGSREPHNVRYWGLGNEPWGCGGMLTPEEYAAEYRRLASWVPAFPSVDPRLIAAGPLEGVDDEAWTRRFIESMLSAGRYAEMPHGYSIHSYFWRRDALDFTPDGWYALLAEPRKLKNMLQRQALLLRAARAPLTLVLDEWGPWYIGDTGQTDPSHLFEQIPTLRDALVTAMMFDIFHAHANVLSVATVAQTVNSIHSLFLTQGDRCVRTPVYHAFALYQPHIGGTAVRTVAVAEQIGFTMDGREAGPTATSGAEGTRGWVDGVSASATIHEPPGSGSGRIVLTVTNPRLEQAVTVTIALHGAVVRSGNVTTLTHSDMHARNTFAEPNAVHVGATTPLVLPTNGASDTFTLTLSPASVTRVVGTLGR